MTAGDCVTANPKTIRLDEFAMTALNLMEEKKITSLVVVDDKGEVAGIIHLHDLWGTQMV
jgi:arabinose-5-phosphate isomerase